MHSPEIEGQLTMAMTIQRSSHPSCERRHRVINRRRTRMKATQVRDIETAMMVGPQFGMSLVVT
jgi:hypothetical protein